MPTWSPAAGAATKRPGTSWSTASRAMSTRSRRGSTGSSQHDAEDVFQEVFARTYERLDELRDDAAVRPWIGTLTRRLCLDKLRAGGREQPIEEAEEITESRRRVRGAGRGARGARGDEGPARALRRDPGPLLRARRELQDDRRVPRHSGRDDREPDLALPLQDEINSREENRAFSRQGNDDAQIRHTTKSGSPICSRRCLRRPRAGSGQRRSCPPPAPRWTRSSPAPRPTSAFREAAIADLEAALAAEGYDVDRACCRLCGSASSV